MISVAAVVMKSPSKRVIPLQMLTHLRKRRKFRRRKKSLSLAPSPVAMKSQLLSLRKLLRKSLRKKRLRNNQLLLKNKSRRRNLLLQKNQNQNQSQSHLLKLSQLRKFLNMKVLPNLLMKNLRNRKLLEKLVLLRNNRKKI